VYYFSQSYSWFSSLDSFFSFFCVQDKLQSEFDVKLQHNRIIEEQKTAKKRAKRLKKKGKPANKKSKKELEETKSESESSSTEDGEEDSNCVTTPKEEKALAPTADPPTVPSKHTSDSKTPGISVVSEEKIS
jgi:cytoskeletal protein RodZ